MGKLESQRAANVQLKLNGRQVLVVGGTSGIGMCSALRFADLGANVEIVGRNEKAGNDLVNEMRERCPKDVQGQYVFSKVDVTNMKDVHAYATKLLAEKPHIDTLVVCASTFVNEYRVTPEGLEFKFAMNVLSRYYLSVVLLPLLRKSTVGGRVINIFAPGSGGSVDMDQLMLTTHYSNFRSALQYPSMTEYYVEHLAETHKEPNDPVFVHLNPGAVNTTTPEKLAAFPWYLQGPMKFISRFIKSPEDAAESIVYIATDASYNRDSGVSGKGLNAVGDVISGTSWVRNHPEAKKPIVAFLDRFVERINQDAPLLP